MQRTGSGAGARVGAEAAARRRRGQRPVAGVELDPHGWPPAPLVALGGALARYHRHRVEHLERLGRVLRAGRRVVLVGNHALDVVDPLLFITAVLRRYRRVPRFMAHQSWFRLPVLDRFSAQYRIVPSRNMEAAAEALVRDGFLMLYPGGVWEAAMRSYRDEPYHLVWDGRSGFLRLALEHDAEVLFVAAVGNDEMYYQSRLPAPEAVVRLADAGHGARYRGARLRLGLLGVQLFPGIWPLPVQVTHVVSNPIPLGDRALARSDPEALAALHRAVWRRCQAFLTRAVSRRERSADLADLAIRTGQRFLHRLGV